MSKDAAARAYAQYHDEPIAIAIVHEGRVKRIYRHIKFPRMSVGQGEEVPRSSIYWRARGGRTMTNLGETYAGQWLESDWGKKLPDLYEQVLFQQSDYALIMLWPEFSDEEEDDDPDEDRTSKQRLAARVRR